MSEPRAVDGMSEIVRTTARLIRVFILVYGIYLVLYGHLTPGGGFAGGVVIACGFVLLSLTGGQREGLRFFPRQAASTLDSVGVLLFLMLACLGAWWGGEAFFTNFIATAEENHFTLLSGGIIPLANIGLGLKVASSLFLVFVVLAALRIAVRERDDAGGEP